MTPLLPRLQSRGVLLTTPEHRMSARLKRQELWQQGRKVRPGIIVMGRDKGAKGWLGMCGWCSQRRGTGCGG